MDVVGCLMCSTEMGGRDAASEYVGMCSRAVRHGWGMLVIHASSSLITSRSPCTQTGAFWGQGASRCCSSSRMIARIKARSCTFPEGLVGRESYWRRIACRFSRRWHIARTSAMVLGFCIARELKAKDEISFMMCRTISVSGMSLSTRRHSPATSSMYEA